MAQCDQTLRLIADGWCAKFVYLLQLVYFLIIFTIGLLQKPAVIVTYTHSCKPKVMTSIVTVNYH